MLRLATLLFLAVAPLSFSAHADEAGYAPSRMQQLIASKAPFAVVFHADWCPTCRAQAPILKDLLQTPELKSVTLLVADFDKETTARKELKVAKQSTLVVYRQGKEVTRSTGITHRDELLAQLRQAL